MNRVDFIIPIKYVLELDARIIFEIIKNIYVNKLNYIFYIKIKNQF